MVDSIFKATPTHPHHLSVGAVIKNSENHYLLLKDDIAAYDKLSFPTGTVENNEPLEACLYRELMEEASVTVKIIQYMGATTVPVTDWRGTWMKTVLWFECQLTGTQQASNIVWVKKPNFSNIDPNRSPGILLTELINKENK